MPRAHKRAETAFLIALTAAGAFLRFYGIGKECLWVDEIQTTWRVSLTLGRLVDDLTLKPLFPPLYFVLLRAWGFLFGFNPAPLRSFSALWGIASIPLVYLLAREMFGRRAAAVASLLFAFSSFNIYYSQEAKMYAMWWALVLLSNLFFVRAVKHGARWRDLVPYAAVTAASLWTHNFTVLVIISQVLYLLIARTPREGGKWLLAYLMAALLYSPWPVIFFAENALARGGAGMEGVFASTAGALDWIPVPTPSAFFLNFVIYASGVRFYAYDVDTWGLSWHLPFTGANYLCFLVLLLLLWPALRGGRGERSFPLLIGILVLVPSVGLFLYSRFVQPFWQPRYIGFVSALLFVALGYGCSLSARKLLAGAAVAVLLVLNFSILDFYYTDRVKKPWDDLVVYLSPRLEEGASILFPHKVGRRTFRHYWELGGERSVESLNLECPYFEDEEVREKISNFDDVWLVISYSMPRERKEVGRRGPAVKGYRQYPMTFSNGLAVARYVREQ
jgi:mannosyltransferase